MAFSLSIMALAARNGAPTDLPGWDPANLTSVAPQPNRCRIGRTSPAGVAELQHRLATVNSSCAYWETGSDWLGEATRASACRSSARYRLRLARGGREDEWHVDLAFWLNLGKLGRHPGYPP